MRTLPRGLAALAVAALFAATAPAADPTAFDKLPAGTDFASTSLRTGEIFDAIGKSRAWALVRDDKFVKELVKKATEQYEKGEGDWAAVKALLSDPANKDWGPLALDAISGEVFVAAVAGGPEAAAMLGEFSASGNGFQAFLEGARNPGGNQDAAKMRLRSILRAFNAKPEAIVVPELLVGFKVSDPAKVTAQLKRLDAFLPMVLAGGPLEGRFGTAKAGGDDFRSLRLDGDLIPWKQVEDRLEELEDKPNEFKPLVKHLKTLKLTVSLGVRQGYLLLAIAPGTDVLAKFGGPGPKLAERPELKPVANAGTKPLLSISYASAKLRQATAPKPEDVAATFGMVKEGLAQADQLPAEQRRDIEKDLDALAKEIGSTFKPPLAATSYSVRTAAGWETFSHDFSPTAGPSKTPLPVLRQVGGSPILVAAYRSGTTVDDYRNVVKWLGVFNTHAQTFATAVAPNGDAFVTLYREQALPLFREFGDIVEKSWLPAVADGQTAVVIDGKWTSKQWHPALPAGAKPLPMLELGFVLGVSDAKKFTEAIEGWRAWANKVAATVRNLNPDGVPEIVIAKPKTEKAGDATLAWYDIPNELGADPQFVPTAGLTGSYAALSLSKGHTARLLKATPWATAPAPLADPAKPLDSAFHLNGGALVDLLGPWAEMFAASVPPLDGGPNPAEYLPKVLSLARCFRGYSSATWRDAAGTVTHSEAVFADIPAGKK